MDLIIWAFLRDGGKKAKSESQHCQSGAVTPGASVLTSLRPNFFLCKMGMAFNFFYCKGQCHKHLRGEGLVSIIHNLVLLLLF